MGRARLPSWVPLAVLAASLSAGCMLLDVAQHNAIRQTACTISGSVMTGKPAPRPILVVLLRHGDEKSAPPASWRVVDHYLLEHPGNWGFFVGDGRYAVAAFQDDSGDLRYQPAEPYDAAGLDEPMTCKGGGQLARVSLAIPEKSPRPFPYALDVVAADARGAEEQARSTLGQLTALGEVVPLSDARFSKTHVDDGVWRRFDFMYTARGGVYFLQPYDPRKVPVLFVHGMFGSPTNFSELIDALDKTKYQPWVYYYPSGAPLGSIADHLAQTMVKIEARYDPPRYAVVAHSMGGLVSRAFILQHARTSTAGLIPLLVTISSPWGGDTAAQMGVSLAPAVVPVWRDMSPKSEFLASLFARALPPETRHHLLFTFRRNSALIGESSDRTVTVASQLRPQAQREAVRLYGFDEGHDGVLTDPQVAATLNEILARTF